MNEIEATARQIVHSAIKVHKALGPGLLETVYQKCLSVLSALAVQIIHEAQLLTYLKLAQLKLGFLLNWNEILMKDGIRRMVNNL